MLNIELVKQAKYLKNIGCSYNDISFKMHLTLSQVKYLCKSNLEQLLKIQKEKNDFEQKVCKIISESFSLNEVCQKLNWHSTNTRYEQINKIIKKYQINIEHFSTINCTNIQKEKFNLNDILIQHSNVSSSKLKNKLLQEKIKEHKCECCGNTEWNGKPIPLELHHINGDHYDNRLENLQLLCPNCHAQTETFAGKNKQNNKIHTYICENCGKEFNSSYRKRRFCSQKCSKEYMKNHYADFVGENKNIYKSKCPTKTEIIDDFKLCKTIQGLAKKYDVSGTSIKHWLIKLNLPYHTKELKEYIKNI